MNVKVICVDGTESDHVVELKDSIDSIHELIGAECCDTVNLRDGRVMMVDDDGWETEEHSEMVTEDGHTFERITLTPMRPRKPINEKATKLYWSVCKPGTIHQIAGDVAIVVDADFK
jgi:hypothetical protein